MMRLLVPILLAALMLPNVAFAAGTAPVPLEAVTAGAGVVDRVVLRFDQPVQLGSVTQVGFALSPCDCTPTGVVLAEAQEIHLLVPDVADTAWTPQITYTAAPDGLQGADGTPIASFSIKAADGTPPVPLSATAWGVGRSDAVLLFSEPVSWKGNVAEGLTREDLGYHDASPGGATAIDGVIHAAKSDRVDLVLRGGFAAPDDGVDTISTIAGAVADAAGNTAPAQHIPLQLDHLPPGSISDLEATAKGSSSIAVRWTMPADEDVDRVDVRFSTHAFTAPEFQQQVRLSQAPTQVTSRQAVLVEVTGLTAGQHYHFAAAAIDRNGNVGPVSDIVAATTKRDTFAPAAPAGLQVPPGGLGTRWLGLGWTAPADHDGTAVERYELRVAPGSASDPGAGRFIPPPDPTAPGLGQRFLIADLEPGQLYTVTMRSLDEAGNVSPWVRVEARTASDETPPEGTVAITSTTHEHGVPSEKSVLDVAWTALQDPQSPVLYLYEIGRDPAPSPQWSSSWTEQTTIQGFVMGNGRWQVRVAALSAGGMVEAEPFEVIVSRDAPAAPPAPTLVEAGYGELTVEVRGPPEAESVELRWSLEPITDATWAQAAPAGRGPGQVVVAGLPPETDVHLAARATDAAGRSSDVGAVLIARALLDPSPPDGDLSPVSPTHPSPSRAVKVTWNAANDNETQLTYHYRLTREDDIDVGADDPATPGNEATFEVNEGGAWFFHVRARSGGGWGAQQTIAVLVVPPPSELMDLAKSIPISVDRKDGSNVLQWSLPVTLHNAMGLQIWAGNSPYSLVATIQPGDAAFSSGPFIHTGPESKPSSRYVLTAYFTMDASGGYHPSGTAPDAGLAGASAAAQANSWPLASAVLGGAMGVLAAVGAAGYLLWRRRRRPVEPQGFDDDEAMAPPATDGAWHEFNGEGDAGLMDEVELGLDAV